MKLVKKSAVTMIGGFFVLLGLLLVIFPGPAVLFIPLGLAILSIEYPWARKWLRKAQRWMSASAAKLDALMRKRKS